jgi:pyridoxine 4-dehydrogenase
MPYSYQRSPRRRRGIAFVPFFPLGSGFARGGNPARASPAVAATAGRLRCTPAQVALAWLLDLRPEVLLIPRHVLD